MAFHLSAPIVAAIFHNIGSKHGHNTKNEVINFL